ncbi:MAG: hypothetical protein AAGB51_02775 [Planctomycetota bacterium]
MRTHWLAVAIGTFLTSSLALGQTFGFGGLSSLNEEDTDTGEQQLTVDILGNPVVPSEIDGFGAAAPYGVDGFGGTVDFIFRNSLGEDANVVGIYFEGQAIFEVLQVFENEIINGPGVLFEQPAEPQNLPLISSDGSIANDGEETIDDPEFDTIFSIGAENPTDQNGLNQGEMLTFRFELLQGSYIEDLIELITSGEVRIGLLVDFGGNFETFGNNPNPVVIPSPLAFGAGLVGLCAVASRRRRV